MKRALCGLVFLAALCCSLGTEMSHRRSRRGTRVFGERCMDDQQRSMHGHGDTWLRWQGQRVEFCRCARGMTRCHAVPVINCYLPQCYNGGTCKEAMYSSHYICQCPPGFSGTHCEINTEEKCATGRGVGYRGTWAVTRSGANCINWNATALVVKKYHARLPNSATLGLDNHNYCRNPDNDTLPWCYVYSGVQLTWEHCSLPACQSAKGEQCLQGRGLQYRGTQAVTRRGMRCLSWDSPALQRVAYNAWAPNSLALGLGSHNQCRNPDRKGRPWCYVYRGRQLTWEYCDIAKCPEKHLTSITTLGPRGHSTSSRGGSCGVREPALRRQFRIKGGSVSDITAHPWQAALTVYSPRAKDYNFFCGGMLIDSCWVVSAAHCFDEGFEVSRLQVVLGRTFRLENSSSEQLFSVQQYWVHQDYNRDTFDNDIVLLKLQSTDGLCAIETPSVRPVCLPSPDFKLPDWTECEISGYGKEQEFSAFYSLRLKQGQVRLWPDAQCTSDRLDNRLVTQNMLCAGDTRGLDDACKGDSGGPLVCPQPSDGRMVLMGVISWGDGCGKKDTPGVYTRVTRYIQWINTHIQTHSR
ncbi:tissue-type plasminogen activator isoform X2 [Amia ocellicauda]